MHAPHIYYRVLTIREMSSWPKGLQFESSAGRQSTGCEWKRNALLFLNISCQSALEQCLVANSTSAGQLPGL